MAKDSFITTPASFKSPGKGYKGGPGKYDGESGLPGRTKGHSGVPEKVREGLTPKMDKSITSYDKK